MAQLHPAREAPQDGGTLVTTEVVIGAHAHEVEDALQQQLFVLPDRRLTCRRRHQGGESLLLPVQVAQARGDLAHRQDQVRGLGLDDGPWHALVRGLMRVLHQHQSPRFLDRFRPHGAVGAAAGKHDGKAVAMAFRQRAKEDIDGRAAPVRLMKGCGADARLTDLELVVGRDHVDMIGLELEPPVADLGDGHLRAPANDRGELAVVVGREMHDHDIGKPEIGRDRVEELAQRFDATRRGADSDYGYPLGESRGPFTVILAWHRIPPRGRCATLERRRPRSRWPVAVERAF